MTSTLEISSLKLADAGREFYRRGWLLGTSGNLSARISQEPERVCITASGLDKGELDESGFLEIDENSEIVQGFGKPSAETALHVAVYRERPEAGSVMHTHSVWGTILSDIFREDGAIRIEEYEMLKGLSGVTTHKHCERVPIIENSQDYVGLEKSVSELLRDYGDIHGFYLHRHGLYTWGKTISEARRHVEIFEFLFEVVGRTIRGA